MTRNNISIINCNTICSIKGLSFDCKDYTKEMKTVQVFWARLASFSQLGLISDPQISSTFKNGFGWLVDFGLTAL